MKGQLFILRPGHRVTEYGPGALFRVQDVLLTDSLMSFVAKQNPMKETVVLGVTNYKTNILSHAQVSGVFQVQAHLS